jgi:hypothetical protein
MTRSRRPARKPFTFSRDASDCLLMPNMFVVFSLFFWEADGVTNSDRLRRIELLRIG